MNMLPPTFDGITVPQHEWPSGYVIRVTRYADVILRDAFPEHWADVLNVLNTFRVEAVVDIGGPGGEPITACQALRRPVGSTWLGQAEDGADNHYSRSRQERSNHEVSTEP